MAVLFLAPHALLAIGVTLDPYATDTSRRYLAPAPGHVMGTDALGRDVLARTLFATGLSLKVVVQSVAISFVLALALGGVAGYAPGRWPDQIILWVISLLYTVPFILIVVGVFAVVEPNIERAYLVIGCVGWAAPARLVRAEVMQLRGSQFVLAERSFGFSEPRLIARTILPLSFRPALLSLLFYLPELIGIEVGLAFFGLGVQPPTPSLGRMIFDGLSEFYTGWWLTMVPATALLILTLSLHQATRLAFGKSDGGRYV